MCTINPMLHMDKDYSWRWYITKPDGSLSAMSTTSFFDVQDARRDFDKCAASVSAPVA